MESSDVVEVPEVTDSVDIFENVEPLINGDSLNEVYPLALECRNRIQKEKYEDAIYETIMRYDGRHIPSIEILPWKVDLISECDSDSFFVSFKRADYDRSSRIKILTKLSQSEASDLDNGEWYEIKGLFAGFPPNQPLLRPIITGVREIDFGVLLLDSAQIKIYPEEYRNYWED